MALEGQVINLTSENSSINHRIHLLENEKSNLYMKIENMKVEMEKELTNVYKKLKEINS